MEKRIINPWKWQDARSFVQTVEVTHVTGTLYCSGQAAVDADGKFSGADMKTQLLLAIANVEQVVLEAGYELRNIVRLNVFTTSAVELWSHFPILQAWIARHGIKPTITYVEVKSLLETLSVELEVTAVR